MNKNLNKQRVLKSGLFFVGEVYLIKGVLYLIGAAACVVGAYLFTEAALCNFQMYHLTVSEGTRTILQSLHSDPESFVAGVSGITEVLTMFTDLKLGVDEQLSYLIGIRDGVATALEINKDLTEEFIVNYKKVIKTLDFLIEDKHEIINKMNKIIAQSYKRGAGWIE
jgi:hypothetical protein